MLPCCVIISPPKGCQATGKPFSTSTLADTSWLSELVLTLASRLVVALRRIVEGVAVVSTRSQGLKSTVPPPIPPKPGSILAVSHGAAFGPVLQPHQLFSALAVPQ